MAIKRKKVFKSEAEPVTLDENRVNQVVEVISEPETSEAIETIKEDAVEIEKTAEKLEQVVGHDEEKEKQKEVVEELFSNDTSQISSGVALSTNNSNKKLILWVIIVIVVAITVGGGLIFITGGISLPTIISPTPTPTTAPTPTSIPASSLDRKNITIQVLNGGGVVGAASKMKEFLEELGYTVTDTGNASDYTYEETEIAVKKDKEAFIALLEADLNKDYIIGSSGATLGETSEYDVVITVGKE